MISIPRQAQLGKGRGVETQVGTATATATSKELFLRALHVFRNNSPAYTSSFLLSPLPDNPPSSPAERVHHQQHLHFPPLLTFEDSTPMFLVGLSTGIFEIHLDYIEVQSQSWVLDRHHAGVW